MNYKHKAEFKGVNFISVILLNNLTFLRIKVSKDIIDLDIVDELLVSLDGGTPEEFEDLRICTKWSIFHQNIFFLIIKMW